MDFEEREVYPITPDNVIYRCRAQIMGLTFPASNAKKLKTKDAVFVMELIYFGFVYNRRFKHHFLFIDAYSGEDIKQDVYDSRYS